MALHFLLHFQTAPPPKPMKPLSACADAPPLPPPPKNYQQNEENTILSNTSSLTKPQKKPSHTAAANGKPAGESNHVLDTLLEELQTVAKTGNNGNGHGNGNNGNNGNGTNSYGNGHEKQNGNGEKRVNFVDQVKHFPIDDDTSGSDTIKRSPKGSSGNVGSYNGKSNGPLNGLFDELVNGSSFDRRLDNGKNIPPQSTSPAHQDRAHSSTPSSVCSEPASFGRSAAPPPPPRSSSRTMLGIQPLPPARASFTGNDIDELKKQLMSDINGALSYRSEYNGRSGSQTPTAMIQTNAVDVENPHVVKSASSSDSVNSQDALRPTSPYYNHKVSSSIEQQNNNKTLSAREAFFNQLQQNNSNGNNNTSNNNNETEKKPEGLTNGSQWI